MSTILKALGVTSGIILLCTLVVLRMMGFFDKMPPWPKGLEPGMTLEEVMGWIPVSIEAYGTTSCMDVYVGAVESFNDGKFNVTKCDLYFHKETGLLHKMDLFVDQHFAIPNSYGVSIFDILEEKYGNDFPTYMSEFGHYFWDGSIKTYKSCITYKDDDYDGLVEEYNKIQTKEGIEKTKEEFGELDF